MGVAMTNAIYSKLIGPFPQGTWMGILAVGSCLARVLCPICVTGIYSAFGTWTTFGFVAGIMVLILILVVASYRRLVPYSYNTLKS